MRVFDAVYLILCLRIFDLTLVVFRFRIRIPDLIIKLRILLPDKLLFILREFFAVLIFCRNLTKLLLLRIRRIWKHCFKPRLFIHMLHRYAALLRARTTPFEDRIKRCTAVRLIIVPVLFQLPF